jgi:hypothetical protein
MQCVKSVRWKLFLEGEAMSSQPIVVNFELTVNPATTPPPSPLQLVDGNDNPITDGETITLSDETVGTADPGQVLFTAKDGVPPYNYSITSGAIPAGDELSATTNADGSETVSISGTPEADGAANFAVTVTDSSGASVTAQVKKRKL